MTDAILAVAFILMIAVPGFVASRATSGHPRGNGPAQKPGARKVQNSYR